MKSSPPKGGRTEKDRFAAEAGVGGKDAELTQAELRFAGKLLILLSQKVAGDCNLESVN
jgi:hypothetical protein